jgi:hypothetical protein
MKIPYRSRYKIWKFAFTQQCYDIQMGIFNVVNHIILDTTDTTFDLLSCVTVPTRRKSLLFHLEGKRLPMEKSVILRFGKYEIPRWSNKCSIIILRISSELRTKSKGEMSVIKNVLYTLLHFFQTWLARILFFNTIAFYGLRRLIHFKKP